MASHLTVKIVSFVGVLGLPFLLQALATSDIEHGLVWVLLQQIYYFPISWIGQPFFQPDLEVGYWVLPYGRLLTAAIYATLLVAAFKLLGRRGVRTA